VEPFRKQPIKNQTFWKQLTGEHPSGENPLKSKPLGNLPSREPTLQETIPLRKQPFGKLILWGTNPLGGHSLNQNGHLKYQNNYFHFFDLPNHCRFLPI